MFRNMVTSLLKHDRIKTTDAKAKELRRWSDRLITLAKRGDLHARRQAMAIVREKDVVHKLFEEAPKRFGNIAGGYTRVVKIGRRAGDAASISLVELVHAEAPSKKKKKKTKEAAAPAPAVTAPESKPEVAPEPEAPAAEAPSEPVEAAPDTAPEAEAAAEPPAAESAEADVQPVVESADDPVDPEKEPDAK